MWQENSVENVEVQAGGEKDFRNEKKPLKRKPLCLPSPLSSEDIETDPTSKKQDIRTTKIIQRSEALQELGGGRGRRMKVKDAKSQARGLQ